MSGSIWYDVVLMFVNDMEWWSRHSIFGRGDTRVEMVRMCIVWRFDLMRYFYSIGTLDSHKRKLPVSEESKEVHMVMSEI